MPAGIGFGCFSCFLDRQMVGALAENVAEVRFKVLCSFQWFDVTCCRDFTK